MSYGQPVDVQATKVATGYTGTAARRTQNL